jgi:hypothetical protein
MTKPCERSLWAAVIMQAVADAIGPKDCGPHDKRRIQGTAKAWLFTRNRDFEITCALADVEPEYVRRWAAKLIETGGRVPNFRQPRRDRRGSVAQDCTEIEFLEPAE